MTRLDDAQVGGNHYSKMKITPWEFLESCLTEEELRGYFKGEAIVYLAREQAKGGPQDVSKARHVLQRLEQLDAARPVRAAVPCDTCTGKGCTKADACTVPEVPATMADLATQLTAAADTLANLAGMLALVARNAAAQAASSPQAPAQPAG